MLSWHTISSPFVSINNIYIILCFDINSPTPKVFIDFIVKISCIVRHINCMASRKLKKRKIFFLASIFLQSYIRGGFVPRSNPIYIKIIYHFWQKKLNWSLTWVLSQSSKWESRGNSWCCSSTVDSNYNIIIIFHHILNKIWKTYKQ